MERITRVFNQIRDEGHKALIPYIMAGDPSLDKTEKYLMELEEGGADLIELGIPFTDPVADGPTIQSASERSLKQGTTLRKVIQFVERVRKKTDIPLIAMTYYNPVFKFGIDAFIQNAFFAGIDGVIIPDLIPDEAGGFIKKTRKTGLATIFLLAPTSNKKRIKKVAAASTGFIYYVSITGITGAALILDNTMKHSINAIREVTQKPVAVGFGIKTPEDAALVSSIADGIIVGSAIVKRISEGKNIQHFVRSIKKAIEPL